MSQDSKAEKKYRVYSDLHLGGEGVVICAFTDEELIGIFTKAVQDANLIFLGDIYDLYATKTCCDSQLAKLQRIREEYPKFMAFIKDYADKITIITGNHDDLGSPELNKKHMNASANLDLKIGGKSVRLEHGHAYDRNHKYECCCRLSLCPKGYRCFGGILTSIVDFFTCTPKFDDSEYVDLAHELLKASSYDVMIFGHTHSALIDEKDGKTYVNTGCGCYTKQLDETILAYTDSELKITQNKIKL